MAQLETNPLHQKLTELEKWNLINDSSSFDELAFSIRAIADENGVIAGKSSSFSAAQMITRLAMIKQDHPLTLLTRAYGIRRQAAYLLYKDNLSILKRSLEV